MEADELLQRYARGERDFRGVELFDDEYFDDEPFRRKSPVNLKNADLTGINLAGADLSHAGLKGVNFSYADLSGANLSNVDQIEEEFDTCAPMNDLQESEDVFINLSYTKLSKANLTNADLTGADLTGADLSNVDLTNTLLEDVKLIAANLCNASLSGLDLSHLDLSNAKLVEADLTFTDLTFTNLTGADLTGADLSGANIDGTIFGAQKPSEELQQKHQELIERVKLLEGKLNSKSDFAQGLRLGYKTLLRSQQADFIQRLKSGNLLHCETEGQHSELTVISGERLHKLREFCWYMAEKYKQRSLVRDVFINNLKGKLGEKVVKARLGNFITEVDYKKRIWGDGKVDFTVTSASDVGIQVKTRHGNIDTIRWEISSEEVEKNSVLVCILIQEEVSDLQTEYHLNLVGFLPTYMIELKNGKASVAANELWYGGGLRSYLEEFHW